MGGWVEGLRKKKRKKLLDTNNSMGIAGWRGLGRNGGGWRGISGDGRRPDMGQ